MASLGWRVAWAAFVACSSSGTPEAGTQVGAPWPVARHDEGISGQSAALGARTGAIKWTFDTGARIGTASPVIDAKGTVYIGNAAGSFIALRPDGSVQWRAELGFPIEVAAAVAYDGSVYVGANDARVHVFDSSGHEIATSQTSDSIRTSIVVDAAGVAYFETDQQQCSAARGGSVTCTYTGTQLGATSTSVALANGKMYSPVAATYGSITGTGKDGVPIDFGAGWLGAVTADGIAYVVAQNRINAMDVSGNPIWNADLPSNSSYSDVVVAERDAKSVYLRYPQGVIAMSPNGLQWSVDVGASVEGALAVDAEGAVYFGAADGFLYAFDHDGAPLFTTKTGGEVRSSPAIGADGTVYVGSDDGFLYAVGP